MKKYFLAGLVTLLPLAVTFWVISVVVKFMTKPFLGVVISFFNSFPTFKGYVPLRAAQVISEICILIILFLFTLFLGFVARRYFFNRLIKFGDQLLYKIPLVNKVYKTSKEIVLSLFSDKSQSFKQVVLLHFPYEGAYCIGLIATDAPSTCSTSLDSEMVSVYIPTTPNPTTGYMVMCRKSDLIYLKMKTEDAIKYVLSCAVIQPQMAEKLKP
jgi:uncharacterized membrane protein